MSLTYSTIQRVDVARGRIESLNPLVTVQTEQRSLLATSNADLAALLEGVDLVCLTDTDRDTCVSAQSNLILTRYVHRSN